jgi:general secretion pathway protein E
MSANHTLQLQAARRAWQRHGGTVWDHLKAGGDANAEAGWLDRMKRMGVNLCAWQAGDRIRAAGMPVNEGFLLERPGSVEWAWLLLADPWDESSIERLTRELGRDVVLCTCTGAELQRWLAGASEPTAAAARVTADESTLGGSFEDVVGLVQEALSQAALLGASDVHFQCNRQGLTVKLRIDGMLRELTHWASVQRAQEVISRIKVLAQLDITEQRVPQDGRFRQSLPDGLSMDLRVSIMPSVHGEDAVLRLLDRAQLRQRDASSSLDALAFDALSLESIRSLAQLPHGMLLVTGPTGSGKTTTVYGVLSELNSGEEKIITIEDPVEYELPGVLQIPVNERKGLTFAKGLRSILRHDPDRILVGEIRDADTAEIAVQSALTGHQVFTTVHANSLFDVTGRFRHFGLDMFGFVAALNGVVVQRLARALCPHCSGQRPLTERERAWFCGQGFPGVTVSTSAQGCAHCGQTGYRGRFVLAEVHHVDDGLRDLITGQHAISALREHVLRSGVRPLSTVAAQAVIDGRTTLEEVRRVVGLA